MPEFGKVLQLEGQTPLLNVGAGAIYLPRHKFIFHASGEDGRLEERGWMRTAIWLHMLKQRAIASWGEFINRFGVPGVRGEVPYNIWADKKRSTMYQRFLQNYGESFATLFPSDLKVFVDQYVQGGTSRDAFASFIGWIDTQMAILVQGEHLTTEIGDAGSYNASETQAQEKRAVVEDDDAGLCETIRDQFFWSLIWLNAEDLSYLLDVPPWVLVRNRPTILFRLDAQTSRKERLEEMDIARNKLQVPITLRQVQDEGNFDPAGPDEPVIKGQVVTVQKDAATTSTAEAAAGQSNVQPDEAAPPPPEKK